MTNRPLDREETDALKKIASGLRHSRSDWLGGVMFWNDVRHNVDAMLTSGTNDGEDAVEELTDEDAKQRPWVMCRDNEADEWNGPHKLIAVKKAITKFVVIRNLLDCGQEASMTFVFARPLTPEEKSRYSK